MCLGGHGLWAGGLSQTVSNYWFCQKLGLMRHSNPMTTVFIFHSNKQGCVNHHLSNVWNDSNWTFLITTYPIGLFRQSFLAAAYALHFGSCQPHLQLSCSTVACMTLLQKPIVHIQHHSQSCFPPFPLFLTKPMPFYQQSDTTILSIMLWPPIT